MSSKVPVLALAAVSPLITAALLLGGDHSMLAAPEATVEFQDGAGNAKGSYSPGETAAFYIEGAGLGTLASSTATWSQISAQVPKFTVWSLATGAPEAAAFALSGGTAYDTTTPENTPLHSVPTDTAGGTNPFLSDCNALTGEFSLINDINASSTLQVDFTYYLEDFYPAALHRASVTSTSDADGEWAAIGAVVRVGGTGICPGTGLYPAPGLFAGEVLLSEDIATSVSGDGALWVQLNDTITVTYFDSDEAPIGFGQATVDFTSAPPVPAVGPLVLGALSAVFALLVVWRLWVVVP